jgi:hypothetical protein
MRFVPTHEQCVAFSEAVEYLIPQTVAELVEKSGLDEKTLKKMLKLRLEQETTVINLI